MSHDVMNALANSGVFWIALILGLVTVYILPSLIAAIRGTPGLGWIVVLNLLPGAVGWPAALILALTKPRRQPRPAPLPDSRPFAQTASVGSDGSAPVPGGATMISGARYHVLQS